MDMQQYQVFAIRTENTDYLGRAKMLCSETMLRLLHASMGMTTETGEFMDALKRCIIYGEPIDKINIIEELGDLLWYIALATDALDTNIEDVMTRNIAKLRKRYPGNFTTQDGINRDLQQERDALQTQKNEMNH